MILRRMIVRIKLILDGKRLRPPRRRNKIRVNKDKDLKNNFKEGE